MGTSRCSLVFALDYTTTACAETTSDCGFSLWCQHAQLESTHEPPEQIVWLPCWSFKVLFVEGAFDTHSGELLYCGCECVWSLMDTCEASRNSLCVVGLRQESAF